MQRRLAGSQQSAAGPSLAASRARLVVGVSELRRTGAGVLIIAGPGLGSNWVDSLAGGRSGQARLFTNCWRPPLDAAAACGVLLTGRVPADPTAWGHLDNIDIPHIGHLLGPRYHRRSVLERVPTDGPVVEGPLAFGFLSGFDDVAEVDPGGGEDAVGRAEDAILRDGSDGTRPWFLFLYLSAAGRPRPGLASLAEATARCSGITVVYDASAAPATGPARTPLWLEHPDPATPIDPDRVVRPWFCSPLDLLPTLLEGPGPVNLGRTRPGAGSNTRGLRPDLVAATIGDPARDPDDESFVEALLRLAAGSKERIVEHFEPITFVVAVDDEGELRHNLLRYPLEHHAEHQWLIVDNSSNRYPAISLLYDQAYQAADHDLVVFCHQDVFLPPGWEARFLSALAKLEREDPEWGVVGSVGVLPGAPGRRGGGSSRRFRHPRGHWADPNGYRYAGPLPHPVQALDEMWLGVHKRTGVRFDPDLPGFHCYGIDLSLTALAAGRRSYALDAFVWHKHRDRNGKPIMGPEGSDKMQRRSTSAFALAFAASYDYVGAKWRHLRPFASTSAEWPEPGEPSERPT